MIGGLGRAFSPHRIIGTLSLGRCPRLGWGRALGPRWVLGRIFGAIHGAGPLSLVWFRTRNPGVTHRFDGPFIQGPKARPITAGGIAPGNWSKKNVEGQRPDLSPPAVPIVGCIAIALLRHMASRQAWSIAEPGTPGSVDESRLRLTPSGGLRCAFLGALTRRALLRWAPRARCDSTLPRRVAFAIRRSVTAGRRKPTTRHATRGDVLPDRSFRRCLPRDLSRSQPPRKILNGDFHEKISAAPLQRGKRRLPCRVQRPGNG